ncbi:MAG: ABC transporter substrate-binding protein [Firmicutes bacterium]|jgi:peptide/nickel transport system substrate-binding protein|nr:ABC transporter substrate-binding protein [Bacillota bacterium]
MNVKCSTKSVWPAVVCIVLVAALLAGCGGGSKPSAQPQAQPEQPKPPEPKKPVVFTYVSSTEPDLLDPSIWFTTTPLNLNVYQNLLEVNPEGSDKPFTPMLAESYTVSGDGLTWKFKLRQGVKFHDGSPFNAEAVKYSIERTRKINEAPAGLWSAVEQINVVSEYEIEFKLNAQVPFDYIVAAGYGVGMLSPKAVKDHEKDGDLAKEWFKDNAVGTGPYKLKEWKRGEQMVLEKFDDYWGGWKEGYPDIVVIKFVKEYSTARLMLEKGEADMVDFIPADQVEEARKLPGVKVESYPSFETLYFHFNCGRGATKNKTLRQALSYAFNYGGIEQISRGNAKQLRGVLPSAMWGYSKDTFQYTFDLDKAKELLAKAGYPNGGLKLTLGYMAQDELERQLAEMYKSDLAKIGVELKLEGAPWATISTKQKSQDTAYDIFVRYWWPDYVDPHDFMYFLLKSGVKSNYSYYSNPQVDKLIDEAHKTAGVDRNKAISLYKQIQDIVVEDAQSVFVLEQKCVVPMRISVKDFVYNPAYPRIVKFYGLRLER